MHIQAQSLNPCPPPPRDSAVVIAILAIWGDAMRDSAIGYRIINYQTGEVTQISELRVPTSPPDETFVFVAFEAIFFAVVSIAPCEHDKRHER